MKTKYLNWIFLLLVSFKLSAAVRTVNPNSPSPGQFTSLSTAITASANGDTIYLSGGNYVGAGLNKRLVFIGTGHNPDKQTPTVSSVSWIEPGSGCQGSKFIGITFTGVASTALSGNYDLEYINCRWTGSARMFQFNITTSVSGITLRGCIFTGQELFTSSSSGLTLTLTATNCIFAPNTFFGATNCLVGGTVSNMTISGTFTNCQFQASSTGINFCHNASGLTATNCIFYAVRPAFTGSNSATTSTNCLSFNNTNNAFGFSTNQSNLTGVNPLFTTNPPAATPAFSYSDNYRLSASSPGKNYGTDGKDIGVYGGTFTFSMSGEPSTIPVIRAMNLQGATTVPAGTPINVNVISTVKF